MASLALSSGGGAGGEGPSCTTAPSGPAVEFVYRLAPGEEPVTPAAREEAAEIVCLRARSLGGAQGQVEAVGENRIRVVLLESPEVHRLAKRIAVTGKLHFYDWEPNLIGRERRIGGHPGVQPPRGALRRAEREWEAAGRAPRKLANQALIFAGAFPTVYGAVKLASEQKPRAGCERCSAATPRFYMFERSPAHELIAGPVADRSLLRRRALGRAARALVLEVPVGTTIVSEPPIDFSGQKIAGAPPGWFALRDRPALSGEDILDPRQEVNQLNQPNVTFEFTERGRAAFEKVTRAIAARGRARAERLGGRVASSRAEELSGRFAVVFDGEVKTRPTIDFSQYPQGIDGRTGAEIAGGFANLGEASELAALLRIGALPIEMTLVRKSAVPWSGS